MTYLFLQLLLALFLGAFIGVERTFAGKMAGLRTFGLVSMGSCLFAAISVMVGDIYVGSTVFDPLRLSAGVVTGIGFLGGGLIIFRDKKLSGLTTAAGLWVACGIGLAVGFRLFALAIFATILTLFNFTVMWFIEYRYIRRRRMQEGGGE